MSLTMLDKKPVNQQKTAWHAEIAAEFERESKRPNGCVGYGCLSGHERGRVWEIRRQPGGRFGCERHGLDYFWSSITGGRALAYVSDGSVVEHTYAPGETRHEKHEAGHFKVHDL